MKCKLSYFHRLLNYCSLILRTNCFSNFRLSLPLIIIILILSCSNVCTVYGQDVLAVKISVNIQNQPLEKAIRQLESANGIRFSYSPTIIDREKRISIKLDNKTISEVLDQIFTPMGIKFELLNNYIVLSNNVSPNDGKKKQQNQSTSSVTQDEISALTKKSIHAQGRVINDKGLPLVGAYVKVISTVKTYTTDAKGNFIIDIPYESATVSFNYVGCKEYRMKIEPGKTYTVTLSEVPTDLTDVIVVAYGTQSKKQSSSAISSTKGSELLESPTADLTNALTGRVTGITTVQQSGKPGDSQADIFIRGQVSASATPLYIIDGIERVEFGNIDPNEVESISILKDAGATAVFGLKGANGVVLITTKQGKSGSTTMSYSGNTGVTQFGGTAKVLDAYPSAVLQTEAQMNIGETPRFSAKDLEIFKSGSGNPLLYPNSNWFKIITKPSAIQNQHNFNVSGGNDQARYFVSAGYLYADGQMKEYQSSQGYKVNIDFTRFNFRSNIDLKLTNTTNFSIRTAGRLEQRYSPITINYGSDNQQKYHYAWEGLMTKVFRLPSWLYPFFPQYTNSSDPAIQALDAKYNHIEDYSNYIINSFNPYAIETQAGFIKWNKNIIENIFVLDQNLSWLTSGLKGKLTFGYDATFDAASSQIGYYKAWGVDTSNLNLVPSPVSPNTVDAPLSGIGVTQEGFNKTNIQLQIDYAKRIGNMHSISAVLVGQRELLQLRGGQAPSANQGLIGRVSYNYKRRYLFESSASYSGSENYPSSHRYGIFPSVSVGWIISDESFFHKNDWINYLKVRSSIGLVGIPSPSTGRFAYLSNYSWGGGVYFGTSNTLNPVTTQNSFGNPDVTWETSRKRNIGLDATLLKNRLSITLDFFDDLRYNILSTRVNTAYTVYGATQPPTNFGKNFNSGFEVSMNYNDNWQNKILYGFNVNFSYAHNKILITDDAPGLPDYQKKTGNRIGQYYGYKTQGFYNDQADIAKNPLNNVTSATSIPGDLKYQDLNGDGVINSYDIAPIGYSRLPEITYSISPRVTYKRFSLNIMLQGATHVSSDVMFVDNYYEHMLGRWTPTTANQATWPVLRPPYSSIPNPNIVSNDFVLQNSAYLKLRNVQINYTIPQSVTRRLRIKSCMVYVNGQNLKTWTKFLYLDPENYSKLPSGYGASNSATYPVLRVFNFGANIQF